MESGARSRLPWKHSRYRLARGGNNFLLLPLKQAEVAFIAILPCSFWETVASVLLSLSSLGSTTVSGLWFHTVAETWTQVEGIKSSLTVYLTLIACDCCLGGRWLVAAHGLPWSLSSRSCENASRTLGDMQCLPANRRAIFFSGNNAF